ncbi:MAG: SPASM domain-containing protein [Planctomycetota bacterium]
MLKLSRHTLFYNDYPKPGEYLVFNTRTQAIMELNRQVKDFIDRVTNNGKTKHTDKLSPEESDCLNTLKDSGIIVEDNIDETRIMEHWFNQIKYQSKTLDATILTTYQCNFACVYCFEERVKRDKSLSDETAHQIIEWLKLKVEEKRPELLRLAFYGGEPLMNPKAILDISRTLNNWCREKGIKFVFVIVTNGSLIKENLVDEMLKSGLSSIRITLDGDREHHDRNRPFLDGRGSFDAIIKNISAVIDKAKIEISGNFDKDNINSFRALLDYLEQKGLSKKISKMMFAPVVARMGEVGTPSVEMVGCHSLSNELSDDALKLRKELIQRGYNVDPAAVTTSCPMGHDNSMVVIDPYGDIYKCQAFVGRPEFSIGNVREDDFNYRQIEFMTANTWKQCLDCVYVPMCGGGCRFMAQLKHSDYSRVACDIDYYKNIFPELLKMDYERKAL